MSVTGSAGVLSFGPQTGKGAVATTWHRHKAVEVDLGIMDDVRVGQPEVGGSLNPTFPYKAGYLVGGGATLQPRLKDTLGWLLYGVMGKCTSGAGDADPSGGTVYDHVFEQAADAGFVPWMSFRKYIPPKDGVLTTDLGEIYKDCKVLSFMLSAGSDTPLTARVDALGRDFELDDGGNAWAYNAAFEDWQSIPVGCRTGGYVKVGGVELPVVAAQFGWQNAPLDVRQEKVIGDPRIEDITIVSRQFSYQLTVKWESAALYRQVMTGLTNGLVWSPTPFTAAFDVKLESAANISQALTMPYGFRCEADSVLMMQGGSPRLAGGQALLQQFSGVALENANDYCKFTLTNEVANYTWPA